MDKILELRQAYAEKKESYDSLKLEGAIEEVRAAHKELVELKERIELLEEERNLELPEVRDLNSAIKPVKSELSPEVRELSFDELDKEYEGTFLRAFRGKKLNKRDRDIYDRLVEMRAVPDTTPYMATETDADGGFIVPKTVSTQINEYKRQGEFDLTQLVDVQRTSVISGEFTYEKLGTITPWENISQWETIGEVETPQFERKSYTIEDYAGILPLPRTLLQDTDQNLLAYIAKYIARKSIVTRNLQILAVINATYTTPLPITGTDSIKDILDLELDAAFNPGAVIVTNEFGYNFLRKMKDEFGNYLLQPDVTQPDKKSIDGKIVQVIPSRTLPNPATNTAPVFIGEFKEAIRFYDRGVYEVTPTTVGGKAWERNSYDIRVIDRFDVIALDPAAVKAATIDLTADPLDDDGL